MADIINIVVHPGHCLNYDGYNKEIYYEQLDKSDFNLFLHPTVDDESRNIVISHELKKVMEDACVGRTIPEVEKLIKTELEEGDNINIPYASYILRRLIFGKFLSIRKKKKYTKKGYSKILNNLIMKNRPFAFNYLHNVSKKKPIIYGNKVSENYLEFRKTLEDKYPKDTTDGGCLNVHLNATYFNQFEVGFAKFAKEQIEEDDKIYVFGEYYNQCVKALTRILDKIGVKYELLPELSIYNTSCPKTGKDMDPNNKHFLVVGNEDE